MKIQILTGQAIRTPRQEERVDLELLLLVPQGCDERCGLRGDRELRSRAHVEARAKLGPRKEVVGHGPDEDRDADSPNPQHLIRSRQARDTACDKSAKI